MKIALRMKQYGFTLIEIVVVIAIIALPFAAGVTSYSKVRQNSRDSIRKSDLTAIQTALEQYMGAQKVYPPDIATLVADGYLPKGEPKDPKSKCGYEYNAPALSSYKSYELCADTEEIGGFMCATSPDCSECEKNECLTQLQ